MFPISLRPQRWGWLVARGIFGGLAVLLYFTSIEKVGVGVATLLNYTAPVWSLVFAWILLGEKPKMRAILALVLTLTGVFLVATGRGHRLTFGTWEVVAIFAAAVSGMAITSIRATRRPSTDGTPSETNWTVFASFTLVGSLVTLPTVFPPLGTWIAPNLGQWMLLILCALFSVAAQLLMTSALREITAAGIGIIHQSTVVITLLGGWVFFRETLSPRALVGSVVTISGVLWLVLSDR
jgi:drug/metabolite transporter (DMT)-like permease